MKDTKRTALAGVFAALCFVFLFMGSIIDVLDLSSAALASFVILVSVVELGNFYSLGVYSVAAVLAAALLPNKQPAVYFILFSGFYPVVKVYLNRMKPKWLSYLARFAVFDVCAAGTIAALVFVLGIPTENSDYAKWYFLLMIIAGNAAFFVYDLALERAAALYTSRLRKSIFKGRRQ